MVHLLCCIHNFHRQPLVDVLAAEVSVADVGVVVAVAVVADVGVVVAVAVVADGPAEAAEPAGVGGLPVLRLAACMPGKCGSTTVYIVLRNLMDYCMLDIDSFLFLRPSKRVNRKNNTSIKT